MDDVAGDDPMDRLIHNEAHFDHDVEKGAGSTIPCLDLDIETVRAFARGELDPVPRSLAARGRFPGIDLTRVDGRDILLLGSGGGQQSAILGLSWTATVPRRRTTATR